MLRREQLTHVPTLDFGTCPTLTSSINKHSAALCAMRDCSHSCGVLYSVGLGGYVGGETGILPPNLRQTRSREEANTRNRRWLKCCLVCHTRLFSVAPARRHAGYVSGSKPRMMDYRHLADGAQWLTSRVLCWSKSAYSYKWIADLICQIIQPTRIHTS